VRALRGRWRCAAAGAGSIFPRPPALPGRPPVGARRQADCVRVPRAHTTDGGSSGCAIGAGSIPLVCLPLLSRRCHLGLLDGALSRFETLCYSLLQPVGSAQICRPAGSHTLSRHAADEDEMRFAALSDEVLNAYTGIRIALFMYVNRRYCQVLYSPIDRSGTDCYKL
jgi:hypothetical protein